MQCIDVLSPRNMLNSMRYLVRDVHNFPRASMSGRVLTRNDAPSTTRGWRDYPLTTKGLRLILPMRLNFLIRATSEHIANRVLLHLAFLCTTIHISRMEYEASLCRNSLPA